MTRVTAPNTSSASIAISRGCVKSNGPSGNSDSNVSRLSGGTGHPREPFLTASSWKTMSSAVKANDSVASTSASGPSRRTGIAMTAPTAAATAVPATTATKNPNRPSCMSNGMVNSNSLFTR